MIRLVLVLTMLFLAPSVCSAQQNLTGSYRLVSLRITVDGQPAPAMENPSGLLVITPKVYLHGFASANRKFGTSTEEKAALWDTLNFFGGPYRVEGDKLIISVETSFNQSWTGKQQVRTFKLDGKHLTLVSPPMPSPRDQTRTLVATQVWESVD